MRALLGLKGNSIAAAFLGLCILRNLFLESLWWQTPIYETIQKLCNLVAIRVAIFCSFKELTVFLENVINAFLSSSKCAKSTNLCHCALLG